MKITEIVCQVLRLGGVKKITAATQDTVLIRVRTDTGLEGIGEADASPEIIASIIDAPFSHNIACGLREILIGQNPLEIDRLRAEMYRRTLYIGRRGPVISAMAGIDMALWDIAGKHHGEPIHRLLGGQHHTEFTAYASILFGRDGAETADIARRFKEAGYKAIKFGWEPMGESEKLDCELVRGAREGFGDGTLLIDAGCVWDRRTALRRAHQFQEWDIGWLEEPLRPDDIDGYAWLQQRSPVPIAAGESECGRASFKPWLDRQALDIYQIDLARNGFTDARFIRDRIEENGQLLCNHCYKTSISVAACLHWLSTCRDAFIFEDCVEDSVLRHDLTTPVLIADDGIIRVPDQPGLGIEINEELVKEMLVSESV